MLPPLVRFTFSRMKLISIILAKKKNVLFFFLFNPTGGEAFAPLLNYMYTGRLEVTLDNIYSVLLATHLLHMPGALEQCRAALLRLRGPPPPLPTAPPTRAGTILRPVPNRLVGPPLCWSQPALYPSAPVGLSHLPSLHIPPSLSILPNPGILQEPATSAVPYRCE